MSKFKDQLHQIARQTHKVAHVTTNILQELATLAQFDDDESEDDRDDEREDSPTPPPHLVKQED